MDEAGSFPLLFSGADLSITNAGTYTGDWLDNLDGMLSATVQIDFRGGTGGTNAKVYVQTSIDDGNTATDIACLVFTGSGRKLVNFSTTNSAGPLDATDGTLDDDSVLDGVLGDRLRLKVVGTGTWVNTTLAGRVSVR